jgi:hypothetical protein
LWFPDLKHRVDLVVRETVRRFLLDAGHDPLRERRALQQADIHAPSEKASQAS